MKKDIINKIKIRDAYKVPFSDDETKQELMPENRVKLDIANKFYKRGRDDENKHIIKLLKK